MSNYGDFVEIVAPLATVQPQSTNTEVSSSWVSAANYHRFAAILWTGAIASTGTLNFKVEQATDGSGSNAKNLIVATALTDDDDNKRIALLFDAEDMDQDNGFKFLRLTVTAATAASLVHAELFGYNPRFGPPPTSAFDEIKRAN